MKRNLELILTFLLGIIFGVIYICTINAHTKPAETPKPVTEYVCEACTRKRENCTDRKHGIAAHEESIEIEPIVITEVEYVYVPVEAEVFYPNLTFEECDLLEQIAYAEARGEGVKGMILVMNVVLNRVHADGFGDSVEEVIYASGQFYTAGMTPNVSDECHEALGMVLDGVDLSDGALFFNKYGYREGKEPLFQYGEHYFSK